MTDTTTAYAKSVVDGTTIAGPYVRAACQRHLDDLETCKARGLYWDPEAVQRFERFCNNVLVIPGGKMDGQPFTLQPMWQFILGSLIGWKRDSDNCRRFRRAYIEAGKGCAKTPHLAALALYGLVADGEAKAEVYLAAATRDQAQIAFRDLVSYIRASDVLSRAVKLSGGVGREFNAAHIGSLSFCRPLSRESGRTGSGLRPSMVILDEVHEVADPAILEILEAGFKARTQPLLVMATNSGHDRHSLCWQERTYGIKVVERDLEADQAFAYICALDEGDDLYEDPSCWVKANPLVGVTLTEEYLANQFKQAKAIPGKANNIERLYGCRWTDAEEIWITRDVWEKNVDDSLRLEAFSGKRAWFGLDLAASNDMSAVAKVFDDGFTEDGKPKLAVFVDCFTPGDTLQDRADRDGMPYIQWRDKGFLHAMPGRKTRLEDIAAHIIKDAGEFDIDLIAYDEYLIHDFKHVVEEEGSVLPMIRHPQGFKQYKEEAPDGSEMTLSMFNSIELLEQVLFEGRVRFHVNPVLTTAVMGAAFALSPSGDLRYFSKSKATVRIDALVATTMAVGAALARFGDPKPISPWESEGFSLV